MPKGGYEECHQTQIKDAMADIERRQGKAMMSNDSVIEMIRIVERFLRRKRLICYGGTAINNILPRSLQFYDKDIELPDYDFFSPNPVADAKELADIYAAKGYGHVRASSGVHAGTFKVHVDYVPVADLTYLDPRIYRALRDHTVVVDGIHYPPAPYLRMLMHLELSRPDGDISRWDKVAGRLALLDSAFPMRAPGCTARVRDHAARARGEEDRRYPGLAGKLRSFLEDKRIVFAGTYAVDEINHALRGTRIDLVVPPAPFVVISTEAKELAGHVKQFLASQGLRPGIVEHDEVGEIVPKHYSIGADDHAMVIVFEALECHSYNVVKVGGIPYNIATIDTLLTLYLPFLFIPTPLFTHDLLACLCNDLSRVAQDCGRYSRGPLARFDRPCYGSQTTLGDIRRKKDSTYKRLKGKQDKKSKEEWTYHFLSYEPKKPAAQAAAAPAKKGGRTRQHRHRRPRATRRQRR